MNRKFLRLLLAAILLITASIAEAQQPAKIPRIGYLTADSHSGRADVRAEAFRQGLRALGYVEGKNIIIEWRQADGKHDRLSALATELVRLKVRRHRHGWSHSNPPCQASDDHDSYRHDAG